MLSVLGHIGAKILRLRFAPLRMTGLEMVRMRRGLQLRCVRNAGDADCHTVVRDGSQ